MSLFKPNNTLIGKIIRSSLQLFTGNVFMTVSGIVSGYFFALFLGPEQYGIWQTAFVISGYSAILMLSLPIVMRRDYIFLKEEGKEKEAKQMADLVFTYSFAIRLVAIVAIVLYAYFFIDNILFKYSMYTVSVMFILGIPTAFGNIMSKGLNTYNKITWQKVITGTGFMLSIPFVYYYGFKALLIGILISHTAVGIYFIVHRPINYGFFWSVELFKHMVSTAFPIYLVSITSVIFVSIDRLIIASFLGFEEVGFYSLSSFIASPIRLLVSSMSIVLFTQLNKEYGSKITDAIIRKHVIVPQEFFSNILPVVMGVGLLALPILVKLFLPQYSEGILAAQINIFAIYFFLLTNFSSNALFVLNKQKFTAISFFISGLIKLGLSILFITLGYGIAGVAFASVIAYFIYDIIMLRIVYKQINKSLEDYLKHLLKIVLPASIPLFFIILYYILSTKFNLLSLIEIKDLIIIEVVFIITMSPFIFKTYKFIKAKI